MREPCRESVQAVQVAGFDEAVEHGAGAFYLEQFDDGQNICLIVPSETTPRCLPINTGKERGWHWDGSNLTPSVLAWGYDAGERFEVWHGFLRAGRMESV